MSIHSLLLSSKLLNFALLFSLFGSLQAGDLPAADLRDIASDGVLPKVGMVSIVAGLVGELGCSLHDRLVRKELLAEPTPQRSDLIRRIRKAARYLIGIGAFSYVGGVAWNIASEMRRQSSPVEDLYISVSSDGTIAKSRLARDLDSSIEECVRLRKLGAPGDAEILKIYKDVLEKQNHLVTHNHFIRENTLVRQGVVSWWEHRWLSSLEDLPVRILQDFDSRSRARTKSQQVSEVDQERPFYVQFVQDVYQTTNKRGEELKALFDAATNKESLAGEIRNFIAMTEGTLASYGKLPDGKLNIETDEKLGDFRAERAAACATLDRLRALVK